MNDPMNGNDGNDHDLREMEVMQVPVIALRHLTHDAVCYLASCAANNVGILCGYIDEYSYLVWCDEAAVAQANDPNADSDLPASLCAAIKWAHDQGYHWIRFDHEAVVIEGLATY